MKPQAHYNPKSIKWLISLAVMIILAAAVVVCSIVVPKAIEAKNSEGIDTNISIASTEEVYLQSNILDVTKVEKALDASGNVVAYVVTGTTVGYNQESPIEMATTVSPDGAYIYSIDILSQKETEYLGVRVATDAFKNQFIGKKLPLKNSNSITKGSGIDVIAKSTVSSVAVIDGANNAASYVQSFLA